MRTTVTLEPDVERLIQERMRERGQSFKDVVNAGLRQAFTAKQNPKRKFVQKTYSMGLPLVDFGHKALAFASALEDEAILTKLGRAK